MLTDEEYLFWCEKLQLSEQTRDLVGQIRSSDPHRRVRSSRGGNVSGRYPSRKMNCTIQFESHKGELPRIKELEQNPDVKEYYDQPSPPIKVDFIGANDKRVAFWYTPDFFVLRTDAAGWEECKPEEELIKLAEAQPNRYYRDENGTWHCPSAENYAEQRGLYFHIHTPGEINWVYQRNLDYLEDYYRGNAAHVEESARSAILSAVAAEPGITLETLFKRVEDSATRDDVQMLIATDAIYVDLHRHDIVEFDQVPVYPDRDTALAYGRVLGTAPVDRPSVRFVNLRVGAVISWNGAGWKIANVGTELVGLLNAAGEHTELTCRAFEGLVQEGKIVGGGEEVSPSLPPEAVKTFLSASLSDLAEANRRAALIGVWESDEFDGDRDVPERTLRFWRAKWRAAEAKYGNGYVGLLPQPLRGNPADKLPPASRAQLNKFIDEEYETYTQKTKSAVYDAYEAACSAKGIEPASYKTFARAVKMRPRFRQTEKRKGSKAAYQFQEFYWELEYTTPRHGDHPFHIGHIDHTQLDEELVCSVTGANLGRPWLTILIDAFSRKILGLYLTFDPPSYRSCMMALRDCVSRYGRLLQILVTDGGKEFGSVYLETLLAWFGCTKKTRPPAEGRFGSLGERIFGTIHSQLIYNLRGNTQIMREVRQVTQEVNPKRQAVWTLQALYDLLCEYAFKVYDTSEHRTLGVSPRDAFATGMARTGQRSCRLIPYDETFKIMTLPSTRTGTARVSPGRGVKINLIYYWSDSFRDPQVEQTSVPVRYDPWDASVAYAFVRGQWVKCLSQYFKVFRGRSERELSLATAAMRKRLSRGRRRHTLTARKLAEFLASAESQEALLAQHLADVEGQGVRASIDGGAPLLLKGAEPPDECESPGRAKETGVADADPVEPDEPQQYEEF